MPAEVVIMPALAVNVSAADIAPLRLALAPPITVTSLPVSAPTVNGALPVTETADRPDTAPLELSTVKDDGVAVAI